MQRTPFTIAKRLPPRLMLIMALVVAAFAHSPATYTTIEQAKYAEAYTLPDGSIPILCDPTDNGGHTGFESCAFCIIASNAALTGSDNAASCAIAFDAEAVWFGKALSTSHNTSRLLTTSAPRAPPRRIA